MSCFREWRSARNRKSAEEDKRQCPEDLLEHPVIQELNYWISRFVAEVRNKKGEPYLPRTILAGLQMYMLAKTSSALKFFGKREACFSKICGTWDLCSKRNRSAGLSHTCYHTRRRGVLSITNPKALQRRVFFFVEKSFCIRGGQEQRAQGPSNFKFIANPGDDHNCVVYIEHGSKNQCGGLGDL